MAQNPYQSPSADLSHRSEGYDDSSPWSAEGRFGRINYLAYCFLASLIILLVAVIIGGIIMLAFGTESVAGSVPMMALAAVVYVVFIYIGFVFMIKRLHDMNYSGWYSLLTFIPIVNIIVILGLFLKAGDPEENNYGLPPHPPAVWQKIVMWVYVGGLILWLIGVVAAIVLGAIN